MKLYLSEEDVLACLPMSKAIELVERAFHQLADGTRDQSSAPPRDPAHRLGASLHGRRDRRITSASKLIP